MMLSGQEIVGAFIGKRLSDNLSAFKEYLPDIYETFATYDEKRFFLVCGSDGDINLYDKEQERFLYSNDPVRQCLDSLERYKKQPVQQPYYIAINNDKECSSNLVNYIHNPLMNKLAGFQSDVLGEILGGYSDSDLESGVTRSSFNSEGNCFLPETLNMLLFLSVGIGFDLEKLYLEYSVRHLIVVEPEMDIFYASLQLVDWKAILEKALDNNYDIRIVIADQSSSLLEGFGQVVQRVGRHNLAGAFLYSGFYLEEYKELYFDIKESIKHGHLTGYGFYDDSRYSLSHTVGNIEKNIPLLAANPLCNKNYGQDKLPVYIVGNGPSLDRDIEFLKENQKDAVIVSCGTSLRSLVINNVKPDFHVELERTASVTDWISKSAEGVDNFFDVLKDIVLIQASQVHPEVSSFFGRAVQFLKDNETGSSLAYYGLPENSGVSLVLRVAPSCVHSAVTSMVLMGFKEIYFFGTDMGSVDLENHHSKDSLYAKINEKSPDAFKFSSKGNVFKSNFGEKEVYSSGVYPMFKIELERIISAWQYTFSGGLSFYNCSDGAAIKGTVPLLSDDIVVEQGLGEVVQKDVVLSSIVDAYFSYYPCEYVDTLKVYTREVQNKVAYVCDWACKEIVTISSLDDAFLQVDLLESRFHSSEVLSDDFAWVYSLFDGTLLYALSIINSTLQLPGTEAMIVKVVNDQFCELKQFFSNVKEDFLANSLEWDKVSRYSANI